MKEREVSIVVPVYKAELSAYELVSLRRLREVLGGYPIVVVKPRSLSVEAVLAEVPGAAAESFDDSYFRGIAGYNRLMMSEEFYERFSASDYILIYQLDAYVFSDRLREWCAKGYDYVGAPWPEKPVHRMPFHRLCAWAKRRYSAATGKRYGLMTRGRVGNGGLSLRRVDSCLRAVRELRPVVEAFLAAKRHHTFNEDVFFGVEASLRGCPMRVPEWRDALPFAFDKYPRLCYKWNGRRLPFGCHGWYKRKMRRFWLPIILPDGKG